MFRTRPPHRLLAAAVVAATALAGVPAAAGAAPAKAREIPYVGTTKEGSKVRFTLAGRWATNLSITAPMSCGSAQGGTPSASLALFLPPFNFRLNSTAGKATDDSGITKHYDVHFRGRPGRTITGDFAVNWSLLTAGATSADMRILICQATARFSAHPQRG